eukprot:1019186-Pleurochrysis_carterae.AAC.1
MMRARRMDCVASLHVGHSDVLGTARTCHNAPFEKPPRTTEGQDETVPFGRRRRENRVVISKTTL